MLLLVLLFLAAVNISIYLVFQSRSVQTWMAQRASEWLTQRGGMPVQIERLELEPPLRIRLHQVSIHDQEGVEMIGAREIRTRIPWSSLQDVPQQLVFGTTTVDSLRLRLITHHKDSVMNINRWAAALSGKRKPSKSASSMEISFGVSHIRDGLFVLENRNRAPNTQAPFDANHLRVDSLEMELGGLLIDGSMVRADIDHLQGRDHSGLDLRHLYADFEVSPDSMLFQNYELKLPDSELTGQMKMLYDGFASLSDIFNKVTFEGKLDTSFIDFKDLEAFAPGLGASAPPMMLDGDIDGVLSDLKLKHFSIQLAGGSYVKGRFSLKGLPDIQKTFMDWKISKGLLLASSLKDYPLPKAVDIGMKRMQYLSFSGSMVGFLNDFVAYGNFESHLGEFRTDLNLKLPSERSKTSQSARYSGELHLKAFDLGRLTGKEQLLGRASGFTSIKGKGLGLNRMRASLKADFGRFDVQQYSYQRVHAEGNFKERFFEGSLSVQDPNLDLDFEGTVDLSRDTPVFAFETKINRARLQALRLTSDPFNVVADIHSDFKGIDPEAVTGVLALNEIRLMTPQGQFEFDSLRVRSERDQQDRRSISVESDILEGHLTGRYQLTELPAVFQSVVSPYFNDKILAIQPPQKALKEPQTHLEFDLKLRKVAVLSRLVGPDLNLTDSIRVEGSLDVPNKTLILAGSVPGLFYRDFLLEDLQFNAYGQGDLLSLNARFDQLLDGSDTLIRSGDAYLATAGDSLEFNATLEEGQQRGRLQVLAAADLSRDTILARLDGTSITMGSTQWTLNDQPIRIWKDSLFRFDSLRLKAGRQQLFVSGDHPGNRGYRLKVGLDSVVINSFYALMPPNLRPLDGAVYGHLDYTDTLQGALNADLEVRPLKIGFSEVGALQFSSRYRPQEQILHLEGRMKQDERSMLGFQGDIDRGQDRLNIQAQLNQLPLNLVENFISDYVTDMEGRAQGRLRASGNINKPDIQGRISFQEAGATVNFLQTHYTFSDTLQIDAQQIRFNDFQLYDRNRNRATVRGKIDHDYFSDFNLNFSILTDRLLALDTDEDDNELFYGKAFTGGEIVFSGPTDHIFLDATLTTLPGTGDIVLPLSEESSAFAGADYIRYTDDESFFRREYTVNLEGISMDFNLSVTEDARTVIVFDKQLNETLEATGSGDISMKISRDGNFEMYGEYIISDGTYTFNSFDVIYKTFDLREGGLIRWAGDPYNARLDVEAVYKTRASLSPLLAANQGAAGEENAANAAQRRRPVNVLLGLEGELLSPEVRLDFELDQNIDDPLLQRQLQLVRNDEDERNKQVVSLLVLNRFIPTAESGGQSALGGGALQAGGETTAGELVTQVVNAFVLPKLGDNVDVGINYDRRANPATAEQSQLEGLEVAVGVSLLNDRVSLSGSYGVNQGRDVELRYKVLRSGNVQLKAFERNNTNQAFETPYGNARTFGMGVFMQKRFSQFDEVLPEWLRQEPEAPWLPPNLERDTTDRIEDGLSPETTPLQQPEPEMDFPPPPESRLPGAGLRSRSLDVAPALQEQP